MAGCTTLGSIYLQHIVTSVQLEFTLEKKRGGEEVWDGSVCVCDPVLIFLIVLKCFLGEIYLPGPIISHILESRTEYVSTFSGLSGAYFRLKNKKTFNSSAI